MAVTKNADGTYAVGGIIFGTAEEAFVFDASASVKRPSESQAPASQPVTVGRARLQ